MNLNKRWFVVVGTGRSGTQYTSRLFRLCGAPCTHEVVNFNEPLEGPGDFVGRMLKWGVQGDSSWCTGDMMDKLPRDTVIFHQVRNPVATIRSGLANDNWFKNDRCPRQDGRRVIQDAKGIDIPCGEDLEVRERGAMIFWSEWNRLLQERTNAEGLPYIRYRLEAFDPRMIEHCIRAVGGNMHSALIGQNYENFRRNFGTVDKSQNPDAKSLSWASLPDGPEKNAVAELAREYGYTSKELEEA